MFSGNEERGRAANAWECSVRYLLQVIVFVCQLHTHAPFLRVYTNGQEPIHPAWP